MAVTLVHHCPHCDKPQGFTFTGEVRIPNSTTRFHANFMCNNCHLPVVALVESSLGHPPSRLHGNILEQARAIAVSVPRIIPEGRAPDVPQHCPENVARAFLQAANAINREEWDSAGAMDRRALELTTKNLAPEHASKNLAARINALADMGKLTPDLKEWAHSLRFLGNNAVHEEDGIPEAEAIQGHELTRFILTYVYTLPTQVAAAREMRAERQG
ncbi:DUF4145 domain-containing protein [Achromobacter sp. ACM04]|uniref:DUF4145 domain-containing protein n=1 Tax=Achromobacter sp. ACM04 TaxID=2769312 RepID=UPI0017873BC4|nr:DUF4145 domain-containing protein [Achromobacter sp. ACM04]MBD9419838.1 DUF4145 domain-containing protein [Achromobacter sp. ACM04]